MQTLVIRFSCSLLFALAVLFAYAPSWGQSRYEVETTAEQDQALSHWLDQLAAGENSDATSPEEGLQFMLDRSLRGYARQFKEFKDTQVADAYREALPSRQAEIRRLLGLPAATFGGF